MGKFIYALNETARDELVALGYQILKASSNGSIYVFLNSDKTTLNFAVNNCVLSDTLIF